MNKSDVSKGKDKEDDAPKGPTLKDIIAANPGLSVTEALQRLHALNMMGNTSLSAVQGGMNLGNTLGALMMSNINPQASKLAREIYVGNLPPGISMPQLNEFLNAAMKQLLGPSSSPQGSVVASWISTDARYAFVEMRTVEEATAALNKLNGLMIGMHQLKVGRPKTTGPGGGGMMPGGGMGMPAIPLGVGTILGDASLSSSMNFTPSVSAILGTAPPPPACHVIMVSNLPDSISPDQVKELISPFGKV